MRLLVRGDEAGSATFGPEDSPVTVGRSPECQVSIANPRVSRHHLSVHWTGATWQVQDSSSSGTWLGGQRIQTSDVVGPTTLVLGGADGIEIILEPEGAAAAGVPTTTPSASVDSTVMVDDRALRLRPPDGRESVFLPGREVTVGRDPSCELVIDDPLVSRQHVRFTSDEKGWQVEDQSSRGTFIDGRRLRGRAQVAGSFAMELGAVEGGPRLGVVTAGEHRKPKSRAPLLLGLATMVVVVGAAAAVGYLVTRPELPDPSDLVASVPILVGGSEECGGSGSGSVVDEDLVLTNLHVVQAIAECGGTVEVAAGDSEQRTADEVQPAELVAFDSELDLAVVRVGGDFDQPALKVGDAQEVSTGDKIRVLGYPGAADMGRDPSLTVTDGIVSGRLKDANDNEFIKTDTAIAPGNSGGAAFAATGDLIGVPTAVSFIDCGTAGGDCAGASFGFIRPIDYAVPLIEEARTASPIPLDQIPAEGSEANEDDQERPPVGDGPLFNQRFAGVDSADAVVELEGGQLSSSEIVGVCIILDYVELPGGAIDIRVLQDGDEVLSKSEPVEEGGSAEGFRYCAKPEGGSVPPGSYEFVAAVAGRPDSEVSVTGTVT